LEEFDLVSANARFDKEKVMEELSHTEKPNALPAQPLEGDQDATNDDNKTIAYNRSVSFFDNISCESLERGSDKDKAAVPRQTYAEQRKLDAETFGLPARDTRPSYRHHHHQGQNRRPPQHRGGPPTNKVFRPVQNSNKPPAAAAPAENGVSGPKKQ
jgi:protein LSM14